MSDNENADAGKAKTNWTDKERLIYLICLLEQGGTKLDFKNAPRPNGRSEIACERMVGRLKTQYKAELEALKAGESFDGEATPKKTPKRKGKGQPADGSPTKKGKKGKEAGVKDELEDE